MASSTTHSGLATETVRDEQCPACESVGPQRVTIEIRAGRSGDAARRGTEKYSRGPCRVTECLQCGCSTVSRIDNR